ncbi:MAG: glycine dehydrogenase, partial [Chloroflexi bacterium]|nr:glycine dehydrogenase [Chloroflexota bacterium]
YHKAHYAADRINQLDGYAVDVGKAFFNEFVVSCPRPVAETNEALLQEGIIGGYDLGQNYFHLEDHMLVCVTETNSKDEIDRLVEVLGGLS